jgi:hypothetical protein
MPGYKRTYPEGVPVVADIARAADMLDLDPERLAQAVTEAGLRSWGAHASGAPVWRWEELLAVARQLGGHIPKQLTLGPRAITFKQQRGRANQAKAKAEAKARASGRTQR